MRDISPSTTRGTHTNIMCGGFIAPLKITEPL